MCCIRMLQILNSIFNLENIDGNNGGHYRCVASNECGTERSDVFIIYGKS